MMTAEKIINSPLLKDPWPHKVIDSFFEPEDYEKVRNAAKLLAPLAVEGKTRPLWMHEALAEGVPEDTIETIITAADNILDNINEIIADWDKTNKSYLGYYAMPKFGVSGNNFIYPIHSESSHKVVLIVIYLEPDESVGTKLYENKDGTGEVKTIEWKPNSALVICPWNNDVTWHNWENFTGKNRVTLNIFCERLENLQESMLNSAKGDVPEDILWLYEQIGKNRLTTNKY